MNRDEDDQGRQALSLRTLRVDFKGILRKCSGVKLGFDQKKQGPSALLLYQNLFVITRLELPLQAHRLPALHSSQHPLLDQQPSSKA